MTEEMRRRGCEPCDRCGSACLDRQDCDINIDLARDGVEPSAFWNDEGI